MDECVSMSIPMATERLDADLQGTPTNQMTYRQIIEGLMYLTTSRPDIAFATFVCARYQARPMVKHLKEVKRIFQYLRQSYNMGLWYPKDSRFKLIAYSDADHAGCKDDYKSTSGGTQFLGEKLVRWSLKKQDCTAISITKAEYVSLSTCCAHVIWMRTQLLDYGYKYNKIPMYCDSKSATAISCIPVQHSRTKHINFRYPFIKEYVEKIITAFAQMIFEKDLKILYCVKNVIIMAQLQSQADVPQDELYFVLMLLHQYHRYTLKEDGSKYRLSFVLDRKELTLRLDDSRTIFHLPQATDNNHDHFVPAPTFSEMVPFYINDLAFTLELSSPSNFKTTGLIMQMLYCFVNNLHVDYVDLLWEGLRSTQLTPPTPIPTTDEADDLVLQDTLQVSLAEQKSHEELEAKQNVEIVKEHLMAKEIEKFVEGTKNVENVEVNSFILRKNDNQNDPGTRIDPRSNKESLKVEKTADISQPVNVIEEEEESAEDDYELKIREKGKQRGV
ncbi:hypothetical protein Tco_0761334 [Tanacetum coccineum]